jgi:hypothetical protein
MPLAAKLGTAAHATSLAKIGSNLTTLADELVFFSISLAKVRKKFYTLAVEVREVFADGWKEG